MKKNKLIFLMTLILVICSVAFAGCSTKSDSKKLKKVRIGYQKGDLLQIAKVEGSLRKRLLEMGYKVKWVEFQDGSALVEALNTGSIDYGRTGDIPPITCQASGSDMVYVAAGNSKAEGSGILVPKNSDITSLADLKGKTIAFAKGSSSQYLVVKALQKAGLTLKDVKTVYLAPPEGRIALDKGNVDAWAVWDPFTASAEINSSAKLLVNGKGLTTDRDFIIATRKFAQKHTDVTKALIEEVQNSMEWANKNHDKLITELMKALSMDKKTITLTVERRNYGVSAMTDSILQEQQEIADLFYQLKIIPKKVDVNKATLDE